MVRPPCCDKLNVKKGPWTAEEDAKILAYVSKHGTGNWTDVPKKAGLRRCGKSCRLRWTNYLRPDIKHESFTPQEEELIISLHAAIGSRWSIIAQQLPGRTDNDVKNFWNTKLRKKLSEMGIDHVTHKPFSQILADYGSINGLPKPGSRIGSLTRDLKNAAIFKPEAYQFVPSKPEAFSNSCSSMDLLSQLQAIRLVTEATSCRNHQVVSTQCCFNEVSLASSSSSSSSSNATCSTSSIAAFNWQDFLLADAFLQSPPQGEENSLEISSNGSCSSGQVKLPENHARQGNGVVPSFDFEGCSSSAGNAFVEAMLLQENQMFSDFAHLLADPFYD